MSPSLSPNPTWNIILLSLGFVAVFYIFILTPLAYIFIGRPFDKKFALQYYVLEKGLWHVSIGIRLWNYFLGIFLQPYRSRKIKDKLVSKFVTGRFNYQDRIYGKVIDFRAGATKWQIMLANLMVIGGVLFLVFFILFAFHHFILYPELGKAALRENY